MPAQEQYACCCNICLLRRVVYANAMRHVICQEMNGCFQCGINAPNACPDLPSQVFLQMVTFLQAPAGTNATPGYLVADLRAEDSFGFDFVNSLTPGRRVKGAAGKC